MVSMAVVGTIAMLTVPTLFNNVEQLRKKTVLKQALSTVQQVVSTYIMENVPQMVVDGVVHPYFNHPTLSFSKKLNFTKDCSAYGQGLKANGCLGSTWSMPPIPGNSSGDVQGGVLPSGAAVGYAWAGGSNAAVQISVFYDYNGTAAPNAWGKDQMILRYCLGPDTCGGLKVGTSWPLIGFGGPDETVNTALYNEVLGS